MHSGAEYSAVGLFPAGANAPEAQLKGLYDREIKATVLSSSPHTQQDSDGCSTRDITLSLPRLPMPSDYTHSMYQKHMHPHILELDIWNELYTSFNVYMHTLEFYLYYNNSRKMNSSLS